jgi:hypothetical protein
VQTIEIVSRAGDYLVSDVDIELPDGGGWRVAKSVRSAKERTIVVKLVAPPRTDRVRVKILRELFRGNDRQHADVESIRVLDVTGNNRAIGKFEPVRLVTTTADLQKLTLPPSAVAVEPTTAEVLARFDNADKSPALLCNRFGKGRAFLLTTTVVGDDAQLWTALRNIALGEPMFSVSADDARRFRFILTRVGEARVLHVIDAEVTAANYKPQTVEISLALQRLGRLREATRAGSGKPLKFSEANGRIAFALCPDPVATAVLK